MPARNIIKVYLENGFYHLYNRGVENRNIFLDSQDYKVFLHYLKRYLVNIAPNEVRPRWRWDLAEKIRLITYCLMPNHFHLMVKQFVKEGITDFMRALSNSYIRYFNKKYKRIGPLFQGRYKGVLVENESYLLHLTRYIHLNPIQEMQEKIELNRQINPITRSDLVEKLRNYPYSSYAEYLGERKTPWIHPEEILIFFKTTRRQSLKDYLSYQSFVEDYEIPPKEILGSLAID